MSSPYLEDERPAPDIHTPKDCLVNWHAQRATGRRLALAIDVAHFKRFNDTFGHDAGDVVLRELGRVLRDSFRASDISGRLGGEEFVLVLPDTDMAKLVRSAERLGDAVRTLSLVHRELPLGTITVSIGIATFPESSRDAEGLLRSADAALYRAKSQGRDRFVAAERNGPHLLLSGPPGKTR